MRAHFTQQNQSWQTIQPAEQANVFVQHAIASAEEAHSIFEQAKTSISPQQIQFAEQSLFDALNQLHEIENLAGAYVDSQQLANLQRTTKQLEADYQVFQ